MRTLLCLGLFFLASGFALEALGQEEPARGASIEVDEPIRQRWRVGVVVTAGGSVVTGIRASTPLPMDWPEQHVEIVATDMSDNVRRVNYTTLDGGVRQMVVSVPQLAAGERASAVATLDVTKQFIPEPGDHQRFATAKTWPGSLRKFLLPSPYVDSQHVRIQSLAKEIVAGHDTPWDQVRAIFEWVRANVQYKFDVNIKSSVQALEDGVGDCEELTSLFVALCRANKIPARSVWVPGHCYPEFYLLDSDGHGRWIPCQVAGHPDFGHLSESRPILQKGDSFRVAGHPQPIRYVQPTLTARDAKQPPKLQWVMEKVAPD